MQIWGKHVPLFKLMYWWSRYTANLGVGTCVSYVCNGRCNDITPRLHRAFTTLVWPEFHFSFTLLLYFANHAEWDIYWRRWGTKVAYTEALEPTWNPAKLEMRSLTLFEGSPWSFNGPDGLPTRGFAEPVAANSSFLCRTAKMHTE